MLFENYESIICLKCLINTFELFLIDEGLTTDQKHKQHVLRYAFFEAVPTQMGFIRSVGLDKRSWAFSAPPYLLVIQATPRNTCLGGDLGFQT